MDELLSSVGVLHRLRDAIGAHAPNYQQLQRAALEGRVPCRKFGGAWMFREADLVTDWGKCFTSLPQR